MAAGKIAPRLVPDWIVKMDLFHALLSPPLTRNIYQYFPYFSTASKNAVTFSQGTSGSITWVGAISSPPPFPAVSILFFTIVLTSSGVPNGKVVYVPTVPQKASLLPYLFFISAGSIHSGWTGFKTSIPGILD